MGEAKRRKETDPNYGKPKSYDFKGIVVSAPVTIENFVSMGCTPVTTGTSVKVDSTHIHPDELRFSLLFWDKLVWPSSKAISFESNEDELYLEKVGVLERPDYTFYGPTSEVIAQSQIQAFMDLDKREPGVWAFAQGEKSLLLRNKAFIEKPGTLAVDLNRAIPIPSTDVPLAEILEFKQKRKDELINLRLHLDSIEGSIGSSDTPDNELERKIKEIDEACADLLKVSSEWQSPVVLSDLKISISIDPIKAAAYIKTGWEKGQQLNATAAFVGAIGGGLISMLSIKYDVMKFRSLRRPDSPYRYAYNLNKELSF